MGYCVIGFGEVDVDGEEGLFFVSVFVDVVEDGLDCECCAGVGSEGVLRWGDDVVVEEVFHELVVDDGVEYFCNDWEE